LIKKTNPSKSNTSGSELDRETLISKITLKPEEPKPECYKYLTLLRNRFQ
jgi:hypothetical protein